MRVLYITTVGSTMVFFKSLIHDMIADGSTIDIATSEKNSCVPDCFREWGCRVYPISCSRSPLDTGNVDAIRQIRKIVTEGHYDIVHCHTPIAAACTRFACKGLRKHGVKVVYTAHGFHFYKGAPIKNWLLYYPIEKLCARWTDVLITINKEDYERAKKKLRAGRVEYVPGVGIDTDRFQTTSVNRKEKRSEFGIPEDAFLLLSVGELNENKNHQIIIRALSELHDSRICYAIAGSGEKRDELLGLAKKLHVDKQVFLLGFRKDVNEIYHMADAYVLPSVREGLNVSVMEAMASGLPCLVSDIRGNRDMIETENGFLCDPMKTDDFKKAIKEAISCDRLFYAVANAKKVEECSEKKIHTKMKSIYRLMAEDQKVPANH